MTRRTKAFMALGVLSILAFLVAPDILPFALSFCRPDIWFKVPTIKKELFVTIDDAPSRSTDEILGVLRKHHVPATFFVIADRVKAPVQIEQIVDAKQSLGNHLKSTRACSKLSQSEFESDFDACSVLLNRYSTPHFFRPASDFGTTDQIAYARSKGYRTIMGTVFPLDHWITDPNWLVRIARWEAVRGGILIMHDGDVRGGTTAAVLDRLIPELRAAGYSFGRLGAELTQQTEGHPGKGAPLEPIQLPGKMGSPHESE